MNPNPWEIGLEGDEGGRGGREKEGMGGSGNVDLVCR